MRILTAAIAAISLVCAPIAHVHASDSVATEVAMAWVTVSSMSVSTNSSGHEEASFDAGGQSYTSTDPSIVQGVKDALVDIEAGATGTARINVDAHGNVTDFEWNPS